MHCYLSAISGALVVSFKIYILFNVESKQLLYTYKDKEYTSRLLAGKHLFSHIPDLAHK